MRKLILASVFTLSILLSFVFFIFYLIGYSLYGFSLPVLMGLTLITNLILWLVSPLITDWMQCTFYRAKFISFENFSTNHPDLARFLQETCGRHKLPVPKLMVIEDQNPTAFCYGSYPSNARLAVSQGIFKYLHLEEQKAVYAHEIGHIVHKDFMVMTAAAALVQLLYSVYRSLIRNRSRSRKGKGVVLLIAVISYILYLAGTYLLLFLSRTRESLADRFSAETTRNPDALSTALVKIAYGIVAEEDDNSSKELLASTRVMGIADYKMSNSTGSVFARLINEKNEVLGRDLTKILLFDICSPWARLAEIHSTHPLTGRRIQAMNHCAKELGVPFRFDFDEVIAERGKIDFARLHRGFAAGAFFYLFPYLIGVMNIVVLIFNPAYYPYVILSMGFGILCRGLYMYTASGEKPEDTTVFEILQDVYANPMKGRYVRLSGHVIGKADAGSYLGEDVKMKDRSNVLTYLNYESLIPLIGNIIFGLDRAVKMIGKEVTATGWFRRSSGYYVDLDHLEIEGQKIQSYTRFAGILWGGFFIVLGFFLLIR